MTDPVTGQSTNSEYFNGYEKMELKQEQTYLGDLLASDGTHTKNVQNRSNKGLGVINQIMQILESTYFGKYFFEIAMVLRQSLFLSSVLLNSEAWVGYTEKDVRILEKCDEILLTKILDCDGNNSNAMKYLELGILPIRHEIMKRKLSFLQYIMKQEERSMIFKILKATRENPTKNDFVLTCQKYLKKLEIDLSFEEISKMSKFKFKMILKEKAATAAFKYLQNEKMKQTKILDIQHTKLKMQEYLADGDRKTDISKLIFKARGKTLDIKLQKKWKYDDILCSGCNINQESGEEILACDSLGENQEKVTYSGFFSSSVEEQVKVAKVMSRKLKVRQKIREEVT